LKLDSRLSAPVGGEIRFATDIDGIEGSKEAVYGAMLRPQVIRHTDLQQFNGFQRLTVFQRYDCAKHWQVTEPHRGVLRESLFEIVGECFRFGVVPCESQGECRTVLHLTLLREYKC
jgi:hypothetical protein